MKKTTRAIIKIGKNVLEDLDSLKNPKKVDEHPENTIYFNTAGQLFSILTEKKLELLQYISETTHKNVNQISIELHRKKEAISRDLHDLERVGLVDFKKSGRAVYPKAAVGELVIPLKGVKKK